MPGSHTEEANYPRPRSLPCLETRSLAKSKTFTQPLRSASFFLSDMLLDGYGGKDPNNSSNFKVGGVITAGSDVSEEVI